VTAIDAVSLAAALHLAGAGETAPQGQSAPLTLEVCVELAYAAPSAVSIAREQEQIARAGLTAARGSFLPHASLEGAYAYNSPLRGATDLQSFASLDGIDHYVALWSVTEELDTSGRLRAELRRAGAERDAAKAALRLSRRELRRAVTRAYFTALLSRKVVTVARDSLAEAQWFEDRTRRLAEQGEAARADMVQASAQVADLQQELQDAELGALLSSQALASFWTVDVAGPLALAEVLEGPEPPPPQETDPAQGWMAARPETALLDARHRSLLAEAQGVRAERLPQASLTFQYGLDALRPQIDDRGYALFLNLTVPLFDGWRASSASHQLEARARQVAAQQEVQKRELAREYQSARDRLLSLGTQCDTARSRVELQEEALRLSRLRYEGGEGSALEVLNAQAQLAQARAGLYRARAAAWNASEDLRAATGLGGVASE